MAAGSEQLGGDRAWIVQNDRELDLLGNTHTPEGEPGACVILMHGFLGYKDYGFIPVMGERLAQAGAVVHRFNFSCSGMTGITETFERADLFGLDTWDRQVEDVRRVVSAVSSDELAGAGLPLFLVGHSRGGDSAILTAGRPPTAAQGEFALAGVATINAPADCCRMPSEVQTQLLEEGFLEVRSGRTGQTLRIGRAWLQDQLDDPEGHDLELMISRVSCPVLVLQGDADDTVPLNDAERLAGAGGTEPVVLCGGSHVLNVSNPAGPGAPGPVFDRACEAVRAFVLP